MASKGLLLLLLAVTLLSLCRGRFESVAEREGALDYPAEAAGELLAVKKRDYASYGSGNRNSGMLNAGPGHNNDIGIGSGNSNSGDINNRNAFLNIRNNGGGARCPFGGCGGRRTALYGNNNVNSGMANVGSGHNNKIRIGSGNKGSRNINNSGATLHVQNN